MRLDHLLSQEHRPSRVPLSGGREVHAVFVSVRLTQGRLISGALASRMIRLCRVDQYRPPHGGSGNVVLEVRVGPDTLLGPEETDFGRARCGGLAVCLTSCGTGLLSDQPGPGDVGDVVSLLSSSGFGCSVAEQGSVAVCCLRFA